jgi:predicted permease
MFSIVIGRLVLMPLGTSIVIFASVAAGLLPPDRILLLLLLLQGATPTAMSLGTISQMHGVWMDEMAEIMFVVNVVSVPFFTLSVAAFLALLDPESGFLEELLSFRVEHGDG